jgi:hypothetical protein
MTTVTALHLVPSVENSKPEKPWPEGRAADKALRKRLRKKLSEICRLCDACNQLDTDVLPLANEIKVAITALYSI